MLLQIVRQDSVEEMHRLVDRITGDGITREEARRFNREESSRPRRKQFTYRFQPEDEAFRVSLRFSRSEVERTEVIAALKTVLERLLDEEKEQRGAEACGESSSRVSTGGNGRGRSGRGAEWTPPQP